jgi:hypothetical protein
MSKRFQINNLFSIIVRNISTKPKKIYDIEWCKVFYDTTNIYKPNIYNISKPIISKPINITISKSVKDIKDNKEKLQNTILKKNLSTISILDEE